MTHSRTSRRVALLATGAMVGTAFAAAPVAAQGDPTVCDGVIEGPVNLTLTMHQGTNPGPETVVVRNFNAGPGTELGITVAAIPIPEGDYEGAIVARARAGNLPDIVDMDGPFLYNFAWNGFLTALDSCIPEEKKASFHDSIILQGTYDDLLYSLGSFESGMGMWAHKSALDSVGARIPTGLDDAWTAEEFTQILTDLKAAGIGANGPLDIQWWYGAGEWRPYGFATMIQSAGGDVIDRSTMKSAEGKLNGPEAVGAFTTFQGWVNDGLIDLVAEDNTNITVGPDGEPGTGDETPIVWQGHWGYPQYSPPEAIGDDLVLVPLPDFGNGSKSGMGSWNWAASTGPDGVANSGDEADMDAVWAFIDFVTSPEQADLFVQGWGTVPPTQDSLAISENHQPGGVMAMYIDALKAAHTDTSLVQAGALARPATPAYGSIRNAFSDAMAFIIQGEDVQTVLDNAVKQIDQDIEDFGY